MLNAQLDTRGSKPAAIGQHTPEPKQTSKTKADTSQSAVDSFSNRLAETGKAGERGAISITNANFIRQVFRSVPENAAVALCHKANDPNQGGWPAKIYNSTDRAERDLHRRDSQNSYVSCSTFRADSEKFCAKKERFAACHFLLLDDLGTKVPLEGLAGFELSWLIETSPGNHQGGIILEQPLTNGAVAEQLLSAVIAAGLCDAGASGPLNRWTRHAKA